MRGANLIKTRRARSLRVNATNAELRIWNRLRSRQLAGCKFVRQEPIGRYIVDFVCREKRLIVELDGGQHSLNKRDVERDRRLTEHGYRVLRFWNNEVFENMDGVLETIAGALAVVSPPHPVLAKGEDRPLPAGGER